MLVPAVNVALYSAETLVALLPTDLPLAVVADLREAVLAVRSWVRIATVYMAAVVGLLLLRRGGRNTTALVLLAFAVWSLPRALVLTRDLLRYPDPDLPVGNTTDLLELNQQTTGWVDLVTFDTLATLGLAAVMVAWRRGHLPHLAPNGILIALLVLTVVAHGARLLPGDWDAGMLFYLGLCFPVAYGFLLGADELNRPSPARAMRVLATVGVAVLAMTVLCLQIPNEAVRPGAVNGADLGWVLFKLPLAVVLVAATISATGSRERPLPIRRPGPA
jgi:hypothetical protein